MWLISCICNSACRRQRHHSIKYIHSRLTVLSGRHRVHFYSGRPIPEQFPTGEIPLSVTMTYKLHMNGVITGSLNSFCLACDIFLKSQLEATDHIRTPEHKKKSDAVQYSDKFQDEHIKKFKGGYYCEFCNVLMPIASKVNLHINEDEHKHNKGILLLKPLGGDVVAFNNILIEENAWHGLIDGVCSLCNAEFEDETDHKTDASHSLNLVVRPIQFGTDSAIFRHLDDTAVQCLICNKLLAPGRMAKHFDDTEHHELYEKRRIESNGVCQRIDTKENCQEKATNMTSATENDGEIKKPNIHKDVNKNSNEKSLTKDKSKILESIARYQSKGININLETETAFCKKCSKVVKFDLMELENHIENHSSAKAIDSDLLYPSNLDQNLNRVDINDKTTQSYDDKQNTEFVHDIIKAFEDNVGNTASKAASHEENNDCDSSSSDDDSPDIPPKETNEKCSQVEEARDFAKANKITYNGDNNQSLCRICKVHVPASLRSMREHVEGANHKRLVVVSQNTSSTSSITQPKTPGKQVKQSTKEFVDSNYEVQGFLYIVCIINEEFCILRNSMHLISENNLRRRCLACEVNFLDTEDHVNTAHHAFKWLGVPVITSEKREFIREVRPGMFHCGYCSLVVSGWADMKLHLECSDHRKNRSVGESRLGWHMPTLQRYKIRKYLEARAMMSFINMFN